MAKVLGVGGVFFKSSDTEAIGNWYKEHLGLTIYSDWGGTMFTPDKLPKGAYTVWSPFKEDSEYFSPGTNNYMINLIVDDLDAALAQVRAGGAEIVGKPESSEYGDFGWFIDPDGNKVELWRPAPEVPDS